MYESLNKYSVVDVARTLINEINEYNPTNAQVIDIFVKYTKANQLIPSIRRYAQIYNVNPNTVSRAFRLLEADSIIYPYRTRGYYVSENIQKKKEEYGRKCAKHLLNVLQRLGYSDVEIENMIEEVIKR